MFLHLPLNTSIMQVFCFYDGVRHLTVHFSPRLLTFNRFVGEMRRLASMISFVVSLRSGRNGLMIMQFYLLGSLELCGFKPLPPAPTDPVDF